MRRLLEVFRPAAVAGGGSEARRVGATGFDAVKHLVLCRIERPRRGGLWRSIAPCRGDRSRPPRRRPTWRCRRRAVIRDAPELLLPHPLTALKRPVVVGAYDEAARQCATDGVDHLRSRRRLAGPDLIERAQRRLARRIRAAPFAPVKSLASCDVLAIPALNTARVRELARGEDIARRDNVLALGNRGPGQPPRARGLGLAACRRGRSVGFPTAAAWVPELRAAGDETRRRRLQTPPVGDQLPIIDERGVVPLSQSGAASLFAIFSQRYARGATVVTSNLPVAEWTAVLANERPTGAVVDHLIHHVHLLARNGESARLAQSQRRRRASSSAADTRPSAAH